MIYRHRAFSFATAAMPLMEVLVAVSNPCVDPFPRVSGKKSTKRTKSINGPLYVFRGRINTEVMEVENVEDGTGWCLSCHLRYKDHPFMQFSHSISIFPHLLVMSNVNVGPTLDFFTLIFKLDQKNLVLNVSFDILKAVGGCIRMRQPLTVWVGYHICTWFQTGCSSQPHVSTLHVRYLVIA